MGVRAGIAEHVAPGASSPQRSSSSCVGGTMPAQQLGAASPTTALERLHQRVDGVQRGAAEDARVQIALAGAEAHVEVDQARASPRSNAGTSSRGHAAVEDDAGVGAALVGGEEIDDRVPADLLLAVAADADVDRQRALRGEQAGRLEQQVELPLSSTAPRA